MDRKHNRSDCTEMIDRLRQLSHPLARDGDPIHHRLLELLSKHCQLRRVPFAYGMLLASALRRPSKTRAAAPPLLSPLFSFLQAPSFFILLLLFLLFSLSSSHLSDPAFIFTLSSHFSFYIHILTTITIRIPILALLWECSEVI